MTSQNGPTITLSCKGCSHLESSTYNAAGEDYVESFCTADGEFKKLPPVGGCPDWCPFSSKSDKANHVINSLELAIIDLGIPDIVAGWGEPRHREGIGVKLPTNTETVYRIYDAWKQANEIMNS